MNQTKAMMLCQCSSAKMVISFMEMAVLRYWVQPLPLHESCDQWPL
jgi:hypothetical protein